MSGEIQILPGGTVPFMLRKVVEEAKAAYGLEIPAVRSVNRVIGDCYVQEAMDGEVAGGLEGNPITIDLI